MVTKLMLKILKKITSKYIFLKLLLLESKKWKLKEISGEAC